MGRPALPAKPGRNALYIRLDKPEVDQVDRWVALDTTLWKLLPPGKRGPKPNRSQQISKSIHARKRGRHDLCGPLQAVQSTAELLRQAVITGLEAAEMLERAMGDFLRILSPPDAPEVAAPVAAVKRCA